MKKYILIIAALFASAQTFAKGGNGDAGAGPTYVYLECRGNLDDGSDVTFEVRPTAVPTFIQGRLADSSGNAIVNLKCVRNSLDKELSQGGVLWRCNEYAHVDDGDLSVVVSRCGSTGMITAQIKRKQIFPLPPALIGTLVCP